MRSQGAGARPGSQMTARARVSEERPLLRGWIQLLGLAGVIVITLVLKESPAALERSWDVVLWFGITLLFNCVCSSLYHLGSWTGRPYRLLRALDYASIFLLIAGVATPLVIHLLSGTLRVLMLALLWGCAAVGSLMVLCSSGFSCRQRVAFYCGMAVLGLVVLFHTLMLLPSPALLLLAGSGICYGLGAAVYLVKCSTPWPRILGAHELFHMCILAGHWMYVLMLWQWLLPPLHA